MTSTHSETLRKAIAEMLTTRDLDSNFDPDESLFDSGRLDSIAAVNILLLLETDYGVDLSDPDFDVSQIDTLQKIVQLTSNVRD